MRWETAFGGRIACSLHLKPFACFRRIYGNCKKRISKVAEAKDDKTN